MYDQVRSVVGKIIEWWEKTGSLRNYPWRFETDPYKIIVVEVLLTRTKRSAVSRVYGRFFERFPNPESLATARLEEISEVIRPLGLIKRCEILKRLGKALSRKIPERPEDLDGLPGLGKYSKSLISLRLFGTRRLPVDRVVARTLFRIFLGVNPSSEKPENEPAVEQIAEAISKNFDDLLKVAYALMDFGDEICKPRNPKCESCFLTDDCFYRKRRSEK